MFIHSTNKTFKEISKRIYNLKKNILFKNVHLFAKIFIVFKKKKLDCKIKQIGLAKLKKSLSKIYNMLKDIDYIDTFHQDIVHDISFDWYGTRIATCSSDRKVKIFFKIAESQWKKIYEFTAHDAEVRKVKWAHPDFGSIIATCSYDKSVIIWEEPRLNHILVNGVLQPKENDKNSWIYKTKLLDSKESIEDIKFAPRHMGLMLATASAEGIFRIYEAPDTMNIASWRMIHEENACFYGINSISWSKNPFEPSMLAIACKDINSSFQKAINQDSAENPPALRIYVNQEKWKFLRTLPEADDKYNKIMHRNGVYDVSWAGINGRSFELLASGGKDGIIVWYLRFEGDKLGLMKAELLSSTDIGVWKVSWNMMATVLASSDERNIVRVWKNSGDKWKCIGILKEENEYDDKKISEDEEEFQMLIRN